MGSSGGPEMQQNPCTDGRKLGRGGVGTGSFVGWATIATPEGVGAELQKALVKLGGNWKMPAVKQIARAIVATQVPEWTPSSPLSNRDAVKIGQLFDAVVLGCRDGRWRDVPDSLVKQIKSAAGLAA